MTSNFCTLRKLIGDENGSTAVEYVVIAAALTLALVPGFYYVSSAMEVKFQFMIDFIVGTS